MEVIAKILILINSVTNVIGSIVFAPIGIMPGWLSNTIISAVAGVLMLLVFKHTSNQTAIGKVRDGIKANMLAIKLYKDSFSVTITSLAKVFKGAVLLLFYSSKPMLIMIVPVVLLLAQMGLWYQFKPISPGRDALVFITLKDQMSPDFSEVSLEPFSGYEVVTGPVRIYSKKQVFWKIRTVESGKHDLNFKVGQQQFHKELVSGDGFERINPKTPAMKWNDVLFYPADKPFSKDSAVQSIEIEYPRRDSLTCGSDSWIFFFFIISIIAALLFKPFLNVKI